jgi:two-component system phosphate regulon sensor histidine kinase PhoR
MFMVTGNMPVDPLTRILALAALAVGGTSALAIVGVGLAGGAASAVTLGLMAVLVAIGVAARLVGHRVSAIIRARDLRERSLNEAALREEMRTALAHRAMDGLSEPVLLLDRQVVISANLAARRLLGESLEGRQIAEALRHPDVLRSVQQRAPATIEMTWPGAVERRIAARVAPISDDPEQRYLLLALFDLTEAKRLERMRVDFVANASHELRTPLAALSGFIETLRGPARGDAAAHERFLAIMDQSCQRMARLVDDLMSLSRIEINELTQPSGSVDLAQLAQMARDHFELRARVRNMRVELEVEAGLPAVRGDSDELTQLLHNLVDNALKYGRQGTTVRIRATLEPPVEGRRLVRLSVVDESDGIAREHLPRLTERFYRVDPGRSREAGGTGLGLAIVKHIIQRHRGSLTIESDIGKGSKFNALLPVAEADPTVTKP